MNEIRPGAAGSWISLMDYAMKKGVSLSTLRRHIKANKLTYKVESGRYLLWDGCEMISQPPDETTNPLLSTVLQLRQDLKRAQEEIAELKTLIAFYEEQITPQRMDN
jgi:hypothetical protein